MVKVYDYQELFQWTQEGLWDLLAHWSAGDPVSKNTEEKQLRKTLEC